MSRRRQKSNPVSLFAFQDIITATTGILILLTLVLALSVITQGATAVVEVVIANDAEMAFRDSLISEVESLQKMSVELAKETASWSSATPTELKKKVEVTQQSLKRLRSDLNKKNATLSVLEEEINDVQSTQTIAQTESRLRKTEEQIAKASAEIQALKAGNRIIYNFRKTGRTPWLVQIADNEILASKVDSGDVKKFTSYQSFNSFAKGLPDAERYIVMLVKPSGVSNFNSIKSYLTEKDYDLGTELIGEKQTVIDPNNGTKVAP